MKSESDLVQADLDIHGCLDAVRDHFHKADYLHLEYTLPVDAYSLHRKLQYNLCSVWSRFEDAKAPLTVRECVLLAEAWLIAAADFTKPMYVNAAWAPSCAKCGRERQWHKVRVLGDDPDRWTCNDGAFYEPIEYKLPQSGEHPRERSSE